ncbi:hypothetical protein KDJ21_026500 [Metabacillus litoralis]|uniref:hypothetical protein n=1 Tax=Metabacillus litoralis TaxID=152268 RepID=UPI001E3B9966|nr:hypothetical protein [Metabacillus litoralis]UHA60210.1 hypothetical protein KDJ21_026500 [Metabacillus litoralis]
MTDEMGTLLTQNLERTIKDIEGITLIPYSNIELMNDFAQNYNQSEDELLKVQSEAKDYFHLLYIEMKILVTCIFEREWYCIRKCWCFF